MKRVARKRRESDSSHAEGPSRERWLISYADFITLLLALFVVLYSASQADVNKFKSVSDSIRGAFGSSDKPSSSEQKPHDFAPASEREELQNLKTLVQEMVRSAQLPNDAAFQNFLDLKVDGHDLVVSFSADELYVSGSREVAMDLRFVLDRIAMALTKTSKPIQIRGYADPEESKKSKYGAGYRLAMERALWVSDYFIKNHGFDPKQLSVASYGPYRSKPTGSSEWKAGLNRRIEIVIGKEPKTTPESEMEK